VLTELRIANFAVIEQLSLDFGEGFHVLTGETGAGKSILIDALALLVGGRPSVDQIRAGAEEAELQAAFSLSAHSPLAVRLREEGLLGADETDVIVRRVLSRSGKNRIYLNGRLVPLHQLQRLAGTLVDIHGQHDQQSLLAAETQLAALDAFGGLGELRQAYVQRYTTWKAAQQAWDAAVQLAQDRQEKEDFIRFQCRELAEAHLKAGEEEELAAERRRLSHVQRLGELSDEAYGALYESEAAVLGALGMIADRLKQLAEIDPGTEDWAGACARATAELKEVAGSLRDYRQGLEHDPERLAEIEARLDLLHKLKRKYGGPSATLEDLLQRAEALQADVAALENSEEQIAALRAQAAAAAKDTEAAAGRLTDARIKAAKKLQSRVKAELKDLRMDKTAFEIRLTTDRSPEGLGPAGRDHAEFLLSANPGEPLQPLAKVASGGEPARVMLALKTVLAQTDGVPVLIFDEVDAGIGGAVAAVMGRRLRELGRFHQVFCITHLPQVASQAGRHFLVEKAVVGQRTVTSASLLDRKGRLEEVARMLGGLAITKAVRQTAAEMLEEGEKEAREAP
jgi:DNA repair protein RecN (Recombination protein N)